MDGVSTSRSDARGTCNSEKQALLADTDKRRCRCIATPFTSGLDGWGGAGGAGPSNATCHASAQSPLRTMYVSMDAKATCEPAVPSTGHTHLGRSSSASPVGRTRHTEHEALLRELGIARWQYT